MEADEKTKSLIEAFEAIKRLVGEGEDDIRKAGGGNRAAGTRVRKKMQEIKAAAQDIRSRILESRDEDAQQTPPQA